MTYHLIVAVAGVLVLMAFWIVVQNMARKRLRDVSDDVDVLACGLCQADGICRCGLREALSDSNRNTERRRTAG